MDRAHTTKNGNKHHQTGFDMEPSREEEDRPAKARLATGSPGRHQKNGIHLGSDRKESKGMRLRPRTPGGLSGMN